MHSLVKVEIETGTITDLFTDEDIIESRKFTEDETGYRVTLGAVYRFNESWEGSLFINHADVFETNTGLGATILYHFTDWFSMGTSFVTYDDYDETNVHLGISF